MRTYTAVTVVKPVLPLDLILLWSPVLANEPSAPDEYVGHTEGAVLDDEGHVVAFIVRLAEKLAPARPRTLVPASAVEISEESVLRLSWSEDQLRAQPTLDPFMQAHNRIDGGPPIESRWLPARPAVVPPGNGLDAEEAAKEGLQGGIAGAVVGALAGLAIGGPLAAASLAAFCAAGGGLAGLLSGASHESAAEAGELRFEDSAIGQQRRAVLVRLEERLRDPDLLARGFVRSTRFAPRTRPAKARSLRRRATLH